MQQYPRSFGSPGSFLCHSGYLLFSLGRGGIDTASDFEPINIFNEDAWSNENVPEPFSNLDRFKVRKVVLEKLKEINLLEKEKNKRTHSK